VPGSTQTSITYPATPHIKLSKLPVSPGCHASHYLCGLVLQPGRAVTSQITCRLESLVQLGRAICFRRGHSLSHWSGPGVRLPFVVRRAGFEPASPLYPIAFRTTEGFTKFSVTGSRCVSPIHAAVAQGYVCSGPMETLVTKPHDHSIDRVLGPTAYYK